MRLRLHGGALSEARYDPDAFKGALHIMATTKKPAANKPAAKPVSVKPITEVLSKSGLVTRLSEHSGVDTKNVRAVLAALEQTFAGAVHKKGVGQFTLPGLLKVTSQAVAAKPKRKGVDPFTKEERWFNAKPASVRVKIRPLKKLKDAAL
jgi:nucleoid DNA-binding protein